MDIWGNLVDICGHLMAILCICVDICGYLGTFGGHLRIFGDICGYLVDI